MGRSAADLSKIMSKNLSEKYPELHSVPYIAHPVNYFIRRNSRLIPYRHSHGTAIAFQRQVYEFYTEGELEMAIFNNDEVEGKFDKVKGTVKDKVGEMTGNRRLEAEGEAEHAKGEAKENWGKFKRGVSNAVDSVGDAISNTADKINR